MKIFSPTSVGLFLCKKNGKVSFLEIKVSLNLQHKKTRYFCIWFIVEISIEISNGYISRREFINTCKLIELII